MSKLVFKRLGLTNIISDMLCMYGQRDQYIYLGMYKRKTNQLRRLQVLSIFAGKVAWLVLQEAHNDREQYTRSNNEKSCRRKP